MGYFISLRLLVPLVNRDSKYLCHRVGVRSRQQNLGEAESLTRVIRVCRRDQRDVGAAVDFEGGGE